MRLFAGVLVLGLLVAGVAQANTTLPPRKAGFWVTTMTMDMTMPGMPAGHGPMTMVTAICTDPATDLKSLNMRVGGKMGCPAPDIEGSGGTYTITVTCADPMGGPAPIVTHTTLTVIDDNNIHGDMVTSSAHMNGKSTMESQWQGACPAGVELGDVGRMVNGQFSKLMNVNNMPAAQ